MKTILPSAPISRARWSLAFEANHDDFLIFTDALHLRNAGSFDQIGEARKAVVAWSKSGDCFARCAPTRPRLRGRLRRPTPSQPWRAYRAPRDPEVFSPARVWPPRLWRGGGFRFLLFAGRVEHVEINELVASGDEGAGRLAFPKTIDRTPCSRMRAARRAKSLSLETMQKPEKRPV